MEPGDPQITNETGETINNSLISSLEEEGKIETTLTIALEDEKDDNGDPLPGEAHWVGLRDEGRIVEGKLYVPESGNENVIIFAPGMPGDSNTWMESRLVPELVKNGYAVFDIRHGGTRITGEKASNYVNCPERQKLGENIGKNFLGSEEEYTIEDIDREPEVALRVLADKFKGIKVIGHSNGGSSTLSSIGNLPPEITEKISSYVSLAGFIGQYDNETDFYDPEGIFNSEGMKGYYEYCNSVLNMGDPMKNVELKKRTLERLYSKPLPENITPILVTSSKDEYIPLSTAQQYQEFIKRGLRIIDKTQTEPEYHDLKNLQPGTLIRLLKIDHPSSKHSVNLGEGPKKTFSVE